MESARYNMHREQEKPFVRVLIQILLVLEDPTVGENEKLASIGLFERKVESRKHIDRNIKNNNSIKHSGTSSIKRNSTKYLFVYYLRRLVNSSF